jgi:hypothetical protein
LLLGRTPSSREIELLANLPLGEVGAGDRRADGSGVCDALALALDVVGSCWPPAWPPSWKRLRVDRQLEDGLTRGPDPPHRVVVFGIDDVETGQSWIGHFLWW